MVLLAGLLTLVVAGCSSREGEIFNQLESSDFGLGIYFGQSPYDIRTVLGAPQEKVEKQSGENITDCYLPEDVTTTDSDTPQLALTYLSGRLVRCFNRMYPEDPDMPLPPVFIEPLPGVKLGNRKSDFISALGPETDPMKENEWRFKHRDGRQIVIMASFVELAYVKEQRCSVLQIVQVPAVEELKGEQVEAREKWRERVGLE
jgi:hypothetical protein